MFQIFISNKEDRKTVMAILADNGYTVRLGRVKVGKVSKTVVEAWKDEGNEKGEARSKSNGA